FAQAKSRGSSANSYTPKPELTNKAALIRLLSLLPIQSFSSLINPSNIQNIKDIAAIGLVPLQVKGTMINSLSFYMHIQYPREYYKGGTHQLSLKSLLGFQNNIVADPAANVSLVSISFQPGTILYSPQNPPQTYFYN